MFYYLVNNVIVSETSSNEPQWLRDKRNEYKWWKIVTSPDLYQSIIISENEINEVSTDIVLLTQEEAQGYEDTWHPETTYINGEPVNLLNGNTKVNLDIEGQKTEQENNNEVVLTPVIIADITTSYIEDNIKKLK